MMPFFEIRTTSVVSTVAPHIEVSVQLYYDFTLLAEAFPLCFLALYCHSLRSFGCSCFVLVVSVEEKTSADSRLQFLLSMRIRYLQDLGGSHMSKPVGEPVLSTRASFLY